ncbi:MAG TPA: hypothetical protein VM012_14720 [Flavitalea sp.]|nr:hypothetical protein [Flavitalea sp.]
MIKIIWKVLWMNFIFFSINTVVAQQKYSPAKAHAHNDYEHTRPFYEANEHHFGSVEADVYPVNGQLLVAHDSNKVQPARSLQRLYLEPLLLSLQSDSTRMIQLLVDIKQDYAQSLKLLTTELQPLVPFLATVGNAGRLMVVVSGKRPPPQEYDQYPLYIFFDDEFTLPHNEDQWRRVGLVSMSFSKIVNWKGNGKIPKRDRERLQEIIDSVHRAGKRIRFWAAPDTITSWQCQRLLGVDYIGTDKIEELYNFLQKH